MNRPTKTVVLAISIFLLSCDGSKLVPSAFIGTWQSDVELTLKSVRESDSVTPASLDTFENDFFGDRIMIFGAYESAAYFVGSSSEPTFERIRVVESGEDYMILNIPPTKFEPEHHQSWFVDGELIYAYVEKWKFKEYFRRIDDK